MAQGFTEKNIIAITTGGDTVSATPPDSPAEGEGWWDTSNGKAYVWYNDGSSFQWVERIAGPMAGGGVRIAWGKVASDGTIEEAGSGDWTSAKDSTGNYTVTFGTAFADAEQSIVIGAIGSDCVPRVKDGGKSTTVFSCELENTSQVPTDNQFYFQVLGVYA